MTAAAQTEISEADARQFAREGYLIVRNFFAPDEVGTIREAFMKMGEAGPVLGLSDTYFKPLADANDPLAHYPRMMQPHRHPEMPVGPLALRYLLDARIGAVLRVLFGEEPAGVQSMFYFKPPGARGQDLHQDNFYLRVKPGTCIAAWLAVDRADPENGGMVVVPGSNALEVACPERADPEKFFTTDHVPVPDGLREAAITLEAGDMLFFNGSLIHGSYPNASPDRFRRALIFHSVPKTSAEMHEGYRPALTFDGQEVAISGAEGGGPCGTNHGPQEFTRH